MSRARAITRQAGEGERRWFYGGGTHTWKATPEETNGAFFLFEDEMTEGKVTPLHTHPDADEMTYVLEGEIEVRIGNREQRIGAGGMSFVPRGIAHAFRVVSPTARLLAWQNPGAGGAFFWNASEPAGDDGQGPVDFERIAEVAAETGAVDILGPPPFDAD
jgi:quercetin dioxygenase-like cupin family protein